jgi:protein tyrosine phosphatase
MAQLPQICAEIKSHIDAVREIVKHRDFDDPSNSIPAPIIPGMFYLGNASNAMDLEHLENAHITAVLNCASSSCLTDAEYYGKDFAYHEFDARDSGDYDMSRHLDEAVAFYIKCMEERRAILIHCAAGINRSAFIAIYLYMVVTGATLTQAVTHCFHQRPIILTNESFIIQLALVAHRENRL